MDAYSVRFKPSVEKDLRPLPPALVSRVLKRIESFKSDPYSHGASKLSGAEHLYRIRVGDYRIVYEVDTHALQVTVHYVRHRREVYRKL